jgi:chromosomal replication initiator protein
MTLWNRVLGHLESRVDRHAFATWFRPTSQISETEEMLSVRVPNHLFVTWILENFHTVLREALALEGAATKELRLVPKESAAEKGAAPPPPPEKGTTPLNPLYTFESFVVGSSNQFAHAAARAVGEAPSRAYNPLFLYGGVGLGKTHLLHAIGNVVAASGKPLRIVYLSAEKFMNELINAIRFDRVVEFRERYRSIDVLLVDDIQEIAGKERTQVEFFHTFNALHDGQKQIVLSSDAPPRDLSAIEERLRSRFEWGLIADIHPPELETKIAILRKKADLENVVLPDDVALFLASRIQSNVRELEGLLNRVIAFASFSGNPISIELTKEILKDILREERRIVAPADIIKAVASHYGLKVTEIKKKSNTRTIVLPRQVAMYLLRQLTDLSLPEIGRLFADKHHSTVMHSVESIQKQRAEDPALDRLLNNLSAPFK